MDNFVQKKSENYEESLFFQKPIIEPFFCRRKKHFCHMCWNFFAFFPEFFSSMSENDRKSLICSQEYFSSERSPRQVECNSHKSAEFFFQETDLFSVKERNYLEI